MTEIEQACRGFAAALAALGIDPRRATIVLEPGDRRRLSDYALSELGHDITEAHLLNTVEIGDLTFLEWRPPPRG